jgi:hypothetical protein
MRTFTSYVSEYDSHLGTVPMANLPREQQDELIRLIFSPKGDYRSYVMRHDIEHSQPEGLWTLVVAVGSLLEHKGVIKDFHQRSEADRDWIISYFAPTNLWLRLEEAFPPFENYPRKTEYDWREVETFSAKDAIAELDSDDLEADLEEHLSIPKSPKDGALLRLPYQTFHNEWQAGRLIAYVDRSMAVQVYGATGSAWTYVLPFAFVAGLLAFLPIAVFWNVWVGVGTFVAAIVARKLLNKKAIDWVRNDALAKRDRFRWYSARGIVWARWASASANTGT